MNIPDYIQDKVLELFEQELLIQHALLHAESIEYTNIDGELYIACVNYQPDMRLTLDEAMDRYRELAGMLVRGDE